MLDRSLMEPLLTCFPQLSHVELQPADSWENTEGLQQTPNRFSSIKMPGRGLVNNPLSPSPPSPRPRITKTGCKREFMKRYYLCIISGFINVTGNPNDDAEGKNIFEYFDVPALPALPDHITRGGRCEIGCLLECMMDYD